MPFRVLRNRPNNQAEPRGEDIQDSVQIKNVVGIIQDAQIYERTRERYKYAVASMGIDVYLYRKLLQGRKCSCVRAKIPADICPVCFSTGFVGGFLQMGHEKYILDSTAPLSITENVEIADGDEDDYLRPSPFVLEVDNYGYVEAGEPLLINGALSYDGYYLSAETPQREGGTVTPMFWNPTASGWQPLSTFQAYLTSTGPAPWTVSTRIRVEMQNNSTGGAVPCFFKGLHIKWRTGKDTVKIEQATFKDLPNKLTDLGFVNESSGISYTMEYRPRVSTRDFFVKASNGDRLKIVDATMGDPADQPLWQTLTLRPIQTTEVLSKVF